MDCSTVIVSYNTFALTLDAVRTALDAAAGLQHEVIVVDNASPDGSAVRLRAAYGGDRRVKVVANAANVGFSRANNQGAQVATGRVLFFLNSDTLALGTVVSDLVRFVDSHPAAGAVGPRVLNADGSVQVSTMSFGSPRELFRHYIPLWRRSIPGRDGSPCRVDVVKGCALAVSRSAFDAVGGWDASIFMYAEETELCWALAECGLENYLVPSAQIVHYGGRSLGDAYVEHQVMERRNTLAFLRRHLPHLTTLDRVLGVAGYGARSVVLTAARISGPEPPERRDRRRAAARLFRWFLLSHA